MGIIGDLHKVKIAAHNKAVKVRRPLGGFYRQTLDDILNKVFDNIIKFE